MLHHAGQIVDDEHVQEHPGEPIAHLGGTLQGIFHRPPELGTPEHDEGAEEDHRGQHLYLHLLPRQPQGVGPRPLEVGLVGQETTDEEEQGHAEQDEEGERTARLLVDAERHLRHMVSHDENHRQAAHGIEPLESFLFHHRLQRLHRLRLLPLSSKHILHTLAHDLGTAHPHHALFSKRRPF